MKSAYKKSYTNKNPAEESSKKASKAMMNCEPHFEAWRRPKGSWIREASRECRYDHGDGGSAMAGLRREDFISLSAKNIAEKLEQVGLPKT